MWEECRGFFQLTLFPNFILYCLFPVSTIQLPALYFMSNDNATNAGWAIYLTCALLLLMVRGLVLNVWDEVIQVRD